LCVPTTIHAEIYKWVDADGRTHYSENKADADKMKALDLKVKAPPASAKPANSLMQNLREQSSHNKQAEVQKSNQNQFAPPVSTRPKALSNGRADDSDESRCNLARDVISGAVSHRNGMPTDSNDREIAENEIRSYCH
jgi:hypothetical protein